MARSVTIAASRERLFGRPRQRRRTNERWKRPRSWNLETLEDRRLLATITVSSLADSGVGTLRAAIAQADLDTTADTIDFAPSSTGTISLLSPLPPLTANVVLNGPGASALSVTRSASATTPFRIFTVLNGAQVTIAGMTITGGDGGVVGVGQGKTLTIGGGIENEGSLTITNCAISGNSAADYGGGIDNIGTLTMTGSTISGNEAPVGGGIENGGTMTLTNCTISENTANTGGGIDNGRITFWALPYSAEGLFVTNCTISDNVAVVVGGVTGIEKFAGTITNTLVSGNSGGSFRDLPLVALNHDLITDGPDPSLAPLANYGGSTLTMALLPGSPAIAAGVPVAGLTTDERGIPRPQGVAPDIGAFQSRGFVISIVSGNNQSAQSGSTFAAPLRVAVTSPFGEPVTDGRITFATPANGAFAVLNTNPAVINASGLADVSINANGIGGAYQINAGAAGAPGVVFNLTNIGPPAVMGVVAAAHSSAGIDQIVVGFSESLNPRSATNRRFFSVVSIMPKRRKIGSSKPPRITNLFYDPTTDNVTIGLAKPIKGMLRVTVFGGISAASGMSSHGTFTTIVD
jgi:hypothetical protein